MNDKYEINALSVDIHIHEDIASVLGIYAKQIVGNTILDYIDVRGDPSTAWMDEKFVNCNMFMQDIYKKEQSLVYYKVDSSISALKIKPKLFHDTLYGIRSNISDPTM